MITAVATAASRALRVEAAPPLVCSTRPGNPRQGAPLAERVAVGVDIPNFRRGLRGIPPVDHKDDAQVK